MFPLIYGIVQVALDYLPVLLIPWFLSALTTALLMKGWDAEYWYLCFIPGFHTPYKLYYATGDKWSFISCIPLVIGVGLRYTALCVIYILVTCAYNVIFVNAMFINYKIPIVPFGLYRLYLYWREIITCLKCNKAKSTKKKSTISKKEKKPNTTKSQISK